MDWLFLAVFTAGALFIWLSMAVARKEWREEERLRDLIFDATSVEEAEPREPLPERLARPLVLVVLPHSLDLPLAVHLAYAVTAASVLMATILARRDRVAFAACVAAHLATFWLPSQWASVARGVMLIALMVASLILRAGKPVAAAPADVPTDGYFLLRNGDYAAAAAAFEAALARPMDATGVCRTLTWLSEARHAEGDTATALTLLEAAEAAHPSKPEPHIFRASLLAGRGRYQDALPAAERGMELSPRWKVGRAVLAFVEAGALRPDESRANARQAETAEEPHPVELGPLHYYLAMAAYLREEREETRRHLEKVREAEPEGSLYRTVAEAGLASTPPLGIVNRGSGPGGFLYRRRKMRKRSVATKRTNGSGPGHWRDETPTARVSLHGHETPLVSACSGSRGRRPRTDGRRVCGHRQRRHRCADRRRRDHFYPRVHGGHDHRHHRR